MSQTQEAETRANRNPPGGGLNGSRSAARIAAAAARQGTGGAPTPPPLPDAPRKRVRNRGKNAGGKKTAATRAARAPAPPRPPAVTQTAPIVAAAVEGQDPLAAYLGKQLCDAGKTWGKDGAMSFKAALDSALPGICGYGA